MQVRVTAAVQLQVTLCQDRGEWRGDGGVKGGTLEISASGPTSGLDPSPFLVSVFGSPKARPQHPCPRGWLERGWWGWWGQGGPWEPCRHSFGSVFFFCFLFVFIQRPEWSLLGWSERGGRGGPDLLLLSPPVPTSPLADGFRPGIQPWAVNVLQCAQQSNILWGDTHPVALTCKCFISNIYLHLISSSFFSFFSVTKSQKVHHHQVIAKGVSFSSYYYKIYIIIIFYLLACISTPELNSMHVEANERRFCISSVNSGPPPSYSNTSQSALGMNTHVFQSNYIENKTPMYHS